MTIQTDYEDIEKGCSYYESDKEVPHNLFKDRYKLNKFSYFYICGEENNLCKSCQVKKQTFIKENLKRINEMIAFINKTPIRIDKKGSIVCNTCKLNYQDFDKKLKQLKADKQFLEEKR